MAAEFPKPLHDVWRRRLFVVLAIALALRLVAVFGIELLLEHRWDRDFVIEGDANGYWELATKVATGEDYELYDPPRRALRMPGFPVLIAGPMVIFGERTLPVRVLFAVVGTVCCWLVFLIGRELFDARIGTIAASIAAVSPAFVGMTPLVLSETTFAAAMLLSLFTTMKLLRTEQTGARLAGTALLAGAAIGLACYIRPGWLLFAPLLAGLVLVFQRKLSWPHRALSAVLVVVATFATLLPWALRNHAATGELVWTTLWSGPSLYDGLNPSATGASDMRFFEDDRLLDRMSEAEMNRHYSQAAWKFAGENPGRVFGLAIAKQQRYWSPWPNSPPLPFAVKLGFLFWFCGFFGLAVWGVWAVRRNWVGLVIAITPILYFAALHCLFVGSFRYRLPAEYALCIPAAIGLCRMRGFRFESNNAETT